MTTESEREIQPLDMGELENSLLLKDVDLNSIQGLLNASPLIELDRLELLIRAEKSNRFIYLLLAGQLRIHIKLTHDPIAMIEPGEFVGEISVLDGQETTAYVIANTDCRLLALEDKAVWTLIHTCPTVARNLLFVVSKRLRGGTSLLLSGPQLQLEYTDFTVIDALTGTYNRTWLDKMLPREMEASERDFTLLLVRIDDFETYNQKHGYTAGGYALYTVARTIRARLEPDETVARYDEDQLIVLLPGTNAEAALKIATHLRHLVTISDIVTLEKEVYPPVSISAAEKSLSDRVFQDLVKRMEMEPAIRAEKRHELTEKVVDSEIDHEVAVLEVLKTFKKPMSMGKIANELVAVHWDFGTHHPRIIVHEALKHILAEGTVEQISGGDYRLVE